MKNFICLVTCALVFSSCDREIAGSGNIVSETRSVSSFRSVSASGGIRVDIVPGSKTGVVVEADDNLIDYVLTEVDGSTLKVRIAPNINIDESNLKVHLVMPGVSALKASSSAEISSDKLLTNDRKIELNAGSGGALRVAVDAPEVHAGSSSGAEIFVRGLARDVSGEASSGASIDARELKAESSTGSASSGASVSLFGSVKISCKASSGGTVRYTGGAPTVTKEESSGGSISAD